MDKQHLPRQAAAASCSTSATGDWATTAPSTVEVDSGSRAATPTTASGWTASDTGAAFSRSRTRAAGTWGTSGATSSMALGYWSSPSRNTRLLDAGVRASRTRASSRTAGSMAVAHCDERHLARATRIRVWWLPRTTESSQAASSTGTGSLRTRAATSTTVIGLAASGTAMGTAVCVDWFVLRRRFRSRSVPRRRTLLVRKERRVVRRRLLPWLASRPRYARVLRQRRRHEAI